MCLSVIDEAAARGRHNDCCRILLNCQGAEVFLNGVVAFRCRSIEDQAVAVGAAAHSLLGAGHGEGCGFVVHKSGDFAFSRQVGAVVDPPGAFGCDIQFSRVDDDRIVHLDDLQLIGHVFAFSIPDDQGIRGRFHKLGGHVRCAGAGRCRFNSVAGRQFADLYGRAVRLSVIGEFAARGRHNDFFRVLVNCQGAEAFLNRVVAFRCCSIEDQAVAVGAAAHSLLGAGHREGCGFVVHKSGDFAFSCQVEAVVDFPGAFSRDSQFCRFDDDRVVHVDDVQLAGHVFAFSIPDDQGIRGRFHRSGGHVRRVGAGRCGFNLVAGRQVADLYGRAMSLSVIGEFAARSRHNDVFRILRDNQSSDVFLNRIVACLGCAVPVNAVGVLAVAYRRLGSGHSEGCGFVVFESADAAGRRQRGAVINLVCAFGLNRQILRRDFDLTGFADDIQFRGHIFAFSVPDDQGIRIRIHISGGHIRRSRAGCSGLKRVAFRQCADRYGRAVRLSVIGEFAACGRHSNGFIILGDYQRAEVFRNRVVACLGCAVPVNPVGVLAVAYHLLGSGHSEGCGFVVFESADAAGRRQRFTVINLARAFGLNRQFLRRDRDRVIFILDRQTLGHIYVFFVLDDQGIRGRLYVGGGHVRRSRAGFSLLKLVAIRQCTDLYGRAVRQSVIGEFAARGRHSNGSIIFCDCQYAEVFLNRIVAFLGRLVEGEGVAVGAVAHGLLGTGYGEGRGFAAFESGDGAGRCQRGAAIHLGCAFGLNRQFLRCNLQRAGFILNLVVVRRVADLSVGGLDFLGISAGVLLLALQLNAGNLVIALQARHGELLIGVVVSNSGFIRVGFFAALTLHLCFIGVLRRLILHSNCQLSLVDDQVTLHHFDVVVADQVTGPGVGLLSLQHDAGDLVVTLQARHGVLIVVRFESCFIRVGLFTALTLLFSNVGVFLLLHGDLQVSRGNLQGSVHRLYIVVENVWCLNLFDFVVNRFGIHVGDTAVDGNLDIILGVFIHQLTGDIEIIRGQRLGVVGLVGALRSHSQRDLVVYRDHIGINVCINGNRQIIAVADKRIGFSILAVQRIALLCCQLRVHSPLACLVICNLRCSACQIVVNHILGMGYFILRLVGSSLCNRRVGSLIEVRSPSGELVDVVIIFSSRRIFRSFDQGHRCAVLVLRGSLQRIIIVIHEGYFDIAHIQLDFIIPVVEALMIRISFFFRLVLFIRVRVIGYIHLANKGRIGIQMIPASCLLNIEDTVSCTSMIGLGDLRPGCLLVIRHILIFAFKRSVRTILVSNSAKGQIQLRKVVFSNSVLACLQFAVRNQSAVNRLEVLIITDAIPVIFELAISLDLDAGVQRLTDHGCRVQDQLNVSVISHSADISAFSLYKIKVCDCHGRLHVIRTIARPEIRCVFTSLYLFVFDREVGQRMILRLRFVHISNDTICIGNISQVIFRRRKCSGFQYLLLVAVRSMDVCRRHRRQNSVILSLQA